MDIHRTPRRFFQWIGDAKADALAAPRGFRLAPRHPPLALLTRAIGIGACTAILSVVDAVLLTPPSYRSIVLNGQPHL